MIASVMLLRCEAQEMISFFRGDTLIWGNDTLPYLTYSPEDTVGGPLPLVIFLHGAGERGQDNRAQLTHCIRYFMADSIREKHAFRLLVPQCGKQYRWVETDWRLSEHRMPETPSHPMQALTHLIDSMILIGEVDTSRIYAMGISMGGFGVWDLLQRRPELCAAAVSICGGGDETLAPQLTHIPVCIFHGANDKLVMPQRSKNMYEQIVGAGGKNASLTLYPGIGHCCWNLPFEKEEIIGWLFQQQKR